jgi:hypothetical protein
MNWARNDWTPNESHGLRDTQHFSTNHLFSNIRHTWGEYPGSAPFSSII